MLTVNQLLVYRQQEICRVASIDVNFRDNEDYYKLVSVNDESLVIRIPLLKAPKMVRPLLSKLEVEALLKSIPSITSHGDSEADESDTAHESMIRIIKLAHTPSLDAKVKRQNDTDKATLRRTEKILYNEIATTLNITVDDARALVIAKIS